MAQDYIHTKSQNLKHGTRHYMVQGTYILDNHSLNQISPFFKQFIYKLAKIKLY